MKAKTPAPCIKTKEEQPIKEGIILHRWNEYVVNIFMRKQGNLQNEKNTENI